MMLATGSARAVAKVVRHVAVHRMTQGSGQSRWRRDPLSHIRPPGPHSAAMTSRDTANHFDQSRPPLSVKRATHTQKPAASAPCQATPSATHAPAQSTLPQRAHTHSVRTPSPDTIPRYHPLPVFFPSSRFLSLHESFFPSPFSWFSGFALVCFTSLSFERIFKNGRKVSFVFWSFHGFATLLSDGCPRL